MDAVQAAFEAAAGGALSVTGYGTQPLRVNGRTVDELRIDGVVRATGHPFSITSSFDGMPLADAAVALAHAALDQNRPPAAPTLEQQIVTEPAVLNAVSDSLAAASGLKSIARDIREGKLSTTPKLNGLQGAFAKFTERVEAVAETLMKRMDSAATMTEGAVEKFGGAVAAIEAQAKTIDDAANQLTNGGPSGPLPNGT